MEASYESNIVGYNEYDDISFTVTLMNPYFSAKSESSYWFYGLIALLCVGFILIVIIVIYTLCKKRSRKVIDIKYVKLNLEDSNIDLLLNSNKEIQLEESKFQKYDEDDEYESYQKLQKARSNSLLDDAIKEVFGNRKDTNSKRKRSKFGTNNDK